jgi:hypothetical protein
MAEAHTPIVRAKAGIHREPRWMFPAWHRIGRALLQGLCLADPWVPAFAGTTTVVAANAWAAGWTDEK